MNLIEIRIKAASDTDAVYAAETAKAAEAGRNASAAYSSAAATHLRSEGGADIAQSLAASIADATGSVRDDAGKEIADEITDSISDTIGKELPPKIKDPIKKSAKGTGAAFVSGFQADLDQSLSGSALGGFAKTQGEKFTVSFGDGAKAGISDANLGGILGDALGEGIEDAVPADTLGPDSPAGEKIRENAKKTGQAAGKDMGGGMSPLLVTALAGGLAAGAPLILGAFGGVMAGVTGLALKNNAVIKQDFGQLGTAAQQTLAQSVAPAAATLNASLVQVEGTVKGLTPQLRGMFVDAEPDITAMASGLGNLVTGVLPGMDDALKNSQGIVADLGASMGPLGEGIGQMFQGLTRDANTTGAGMESLLGTVGHLAGTLGGVLGSAASAGGAALMGLDPILNGTLTLVQKVANSGTVGAAGGLFAAMKFDPAIKSGLDSAAGSLSKYASTAVTAEGEATRLGRAASGVAGALEKGASVAGGPWGIAIGGAIGLATGLAGALYNASHASDALKVSQQGLQDAVSKDGNTAGVATAAYIAQQDAANGLSDTAKSAGVSMGLWTQAVLGNGDAQKQVVAAVDKANQSQQSAKLASDEAARSSGKFSGELQGAQTAAQGAAAANNTLTDANAQLINSMNAQTKQVADAISKQTDYQKAMDAVTNSTTLFQASMTASYNQMVASSQQAGLNATAMLDLGGSSVVLAGQIDATVTAYTEATTEAQAYSTVLSALNGTTMSVDQAQNTLAEQMVKAEKSFAKNKYSLDLSTAAGVANRQALVQAATAIQALGDAEYQKTNSINDANKAMKDQETAFVNATGAVGKAKDAVYQYIDGILKIPSQQTTTLTIVENFGGGNTGGGRGLTGGPTASKYATGGAYGGAAATGGARGNLVRVGEQGDELVRMPFGATVIPHSNVESMAASGALGGGQIGKVGVEISFGGNIDGAFATAFMNLVRTNKIQILKKAIV